MQCAECQSPPVSAPQGLCVSVCVGKLQKPTDILYSFVLFFCWTSRSKHRKNAAIQENMFTVKIRWNAIRTWQRGGNKKSPVKATVQNCKSGGSSDSLRKQKTSVRKRQKHAKVAPYLARQKKVQRMAAILGANMCQQNEINQNKRT